MYVCLDISKRPHAYLFFAMNFASLHMAGIAHSNKEDQLGAKLNEAVTEIQECISEGDYDTALIKANTLRFDEDLDEKKAKKWDEQREDLIELINDQKEGK